MKQRHANRIVVVTGGASGIGAAIAQQYCNEGAAVGLIDVNPDALAAQARKLSEQGGTVSWAAADVGRYDECAAACTAITASLGEADTLINNAGISPKHQGKPAPIFEMVPEEWKRVMDVNLSGAFNMVRLLSPAMVRHKYGRIVCMSSVAGKAYLDLVAAHYSTSKAALIGFTRHVAGELGQYGITVNALAPGRIETPLVRSIAPALNQAVVARTPLGRLGLPDEVAHAACFLTSDEAAFITGQVVDVAGGWLMT